MFAYHLRLGLKSLRRNPVLTALMIGAIAIGIAVCLTALNVFTLVSSNPLAHRNDVVYAGFWRRWAALFLDQIIIGLPLGIAFFFVSLLVGLSSPGSEPNPATVIALQLGFYAVWFSVAVFYFAGLESSEAQATFGKRALGISDPTQAAQAVQRNDQWILLVFADLRRHEHCVRKLFVGVCERVRALLNARIDRSASPASTHGCRSA